LCRLKDPPKIKGLTPMGQHRSLYINGSWQGAAGEPFSSHNPATGETLWSGESATAEEVNRAVAAAAAASKRWAALPFAEREAYTLAFAALLKDEAPQLAEAIAQETGRPLWECQAEVANMTNKIPISIEAYKVRCAEMSKDNYGAITTTRHHPHGVLAIFGPFNFPGHLPNGHIVPALLAGNTIVFKPSELTPRIGELTVKIWERSGLPPGVLNLVQGERSTGKYLANQPHLNGLLFTGSSQTGLTLAEQYAPQTGKILALEMGGNNPLVVWNPEDLHAAAYMTLQSEYMTSGQRCTCARRLIAPTGTEGDKFVDLLTQMVGKVVVGAYTERPEPFMGPLITQSAASHILAAQDSLIARGAKPLVPVQQLERGATFLAPGLLDVTHVADRPDEELFGPLLQLIRVHSFSAAIEEANRTAYGLTAALVGGTTELYDHFYAHIKAGVINWNMATTGATSYAPFGGLGKSGNLRPSGYYAADYCAYPVASTVAPHLSLPRLLSPGLPNANV
jgi:succinylglutamic semialdehyde dehydrogenase